MLNKSFLKCDLSEFLALFGNFGLISFDHLFNNSHSADHVSGSLKQTFHNWSILRVRQSIVSPLGLNRSVTNNRTGLGEDTLDQFGSNPESLCAILNTLGANLVNSSLVFRSQLKGIITSIEVSSIILSKSNLSQAKKS